MKLATLKNGSKDGRLHVVSRDLTRCTPAQAAITLQEALEAWSEIEPALKREFAAVNDGGGTAFNQADAMAPLPRAWQWLDGSAFDSHGNLMDAVFGFEKKEKPGFPYMYQGTSDKFYGATDDVRMPSEEDFIDFEGEFGIITDFVPMGTDKERAQNHIRLIVQINDWSLRKLAPLEMKTGFGWIRAKPACSMAPVAVTPDELGANWRDARVDLPLCVDWNEKRFGAASGYAMSSGFHELVAHAAYSRDLVPGTVIGSGTVSNETYREVGSSCIAERRGIEILDEGEAKTPFMSFGDTVQMECIGSDGQSVFGKIDQKVVKN
ncbi:fumarylacetoacetate hydrolase family protein [Rhizobium sp. L1K21]|uniref:fumarylacetoacetate hydrolase family protein n=1 Tax=Rhizobium sp. L1K21 TaxID=2954933 RepID=UPI002092F7DD|nr:fumarylacetoacetate hydrolase family protein [Rhizobium sp. L1K21]MCO6187579.1 fumarylacetoacetate hydrolase family protein [Rhizobium sp. L1K21]